MTRWIVAIVMTVFAAGSVEEASAQAFKPRGGKAAAKKPAAAPKKSTAPKKAAGKSGGKSKKKPSRASESSARPDDLTPEPVAVNKAPEDDEDYVLIEDDE